MELVERGRELNALARLLDRAEAGSGSVLVLAGPAGSGRTVLADAACAQARSRGFEVLRVRPIAGRTGRWVWAQLVRDVGDPDTVAARLLAEPTDLDLDTVAVALCTGPRRLIVVDDLDRGGPDAMSMLAVIAGRAAAGSTAVLATSLMPLGVGDEMWLNPLSPTGIGLLTGVTGAEVDRALWVASRGLPGPARALAANLGAGTSGDQVVALALAAVSGEGFLDIDVGYIRLLETALGRAAEDGVRARLLARLAGALLGDAGGAARRRALVDEALSLAHRNGDSVVLAEVLDARLTALWDPDGAQDRLAAAGEIADLARASADLELERRGLFWRFVALMELGRVGPAEAALADFDGQSRAAGDAAAGMMVVARHAVLASIRGRFDEAEALLERVADQGRRLGLADTERLLGTMRWSMIVLRGTPPTPAAETGLAELRAFSRGHPGHLHEATAARFLVSLGRLDEAGLELDRALPGVLAGSGPRWLGAAADLAVVAVATGNPTAAALLHRALAGYRGRLVVWAGANTIAGPVAHYLGILATLLGSLDDAVELLGEAIEWEEENGTLPFLAQSLAALAGTLTRRGAVGDAEPAAAYRRRSRDIATRLGMPGLLGSLPPPPDEWSLRRDGPDWLLTAGDERARLRDGRGPAYLRALLAAPGREISALDLAGDGAGLAAAMAEPRLDAAGRSSYRRRLAALEEALDLADATGDVTGAKRATHERDALLAELRRATGLGGRERSLSGADERARVNVTRTLRATVDQISRAAPRTAAHLSASIRTGRACRYQPAPGGPSRWLV